jgi:molybdopterin molybdotransferase
MTPVTSFTPLSDVSARLLGAVRAVAPQLLPVSEAAGLVVAHDILAPAPVPAVAVARRRGAAVTASEVVGASPYNPVMVQRAPRSVRPGDELAPPADAVIPKEAVSAIGALHEVGQAAYPGEGAVLPGGDLPAGAVVARAGETLSPPIMLALRLSGIEAVAVHRPVVALRAGAGVSPDAPDLAWLRSMLADAGCHLAESGLADLTILAERDLDAAAAGVDFADTAVLRLALNPGGEIALGGRAPAPVIGVPPRFDMLAGVFFALLLPLLAALTGRTLRTVTRPLTRKLASQVGFSDIALLRETVEGYEPLAVGEVTLSALLAADAVAVVDPDSEGAAAGAPLRATPLRMPFEPP